MEVCTIATAGTLMNCSASAVGFEPNAVAIYGSNAYVSDHADNISFCTVGLAGNLANCVVSNGNGNFPTPLQLVVH